MEYEYIKTGDVAKFLGISVSTVRNWEAEGLLKSVRTIKGQRLFHRADVEKLVPKEIVAN